MLLGVDVGGTFTDAVLIDDGAVHTAKAPTTPRDESRGVLAAIEAVCERAGREPSEISSFSHGMTVGTNALLERRGAETALVATAGFTDLLEIARQDRVSLYELCADRPPPLAPPELRVAVEERAGPEGVIDAVTDAEVERVVEALRSSGARAAALCLLFSFADDANERTLAEAIRERLPELQLSVSSELLPRRREYERASTTVIDAYLAPVVSTYLAELGDACEGIGVPEPVVMQSSGGVAGLGEIAGKGAWSVLSGPAGGAVGAARIAATSGSDDAIGFDMGGTSCDVCVVRGGSVERTAGREIGHRPIQLPMVDVHTVGAGGGSIGWLDPGGALRAGPHSAGADPGPACYGNGGTEPTVTDANLLLGRLPAGGGLAGGVELDLEAAEAALGSLGERMGSDAETAALGLIRVANQEMLRALRVVTVERGIDPRDHDLIAFGGAGGLHAAELARELGCARVLLPRTGGVLSALGLALAERRSDIARTVMLAGRELGDERVGEIASEMVDRAAEGVPELDHSELTYELRYRGQAFELEVSGPPRPSVADLVEDFAATHERRYGYRDRTGEVELVGIRVAAVGPAVELELKAPGSEPARAEREVRLVGGWRTAQVIGGEPDPGMEPLEGPSVFELAETTLLVPEGCRASVDGAGTIEVEIGGEE